MASSLMSFLIDRQVPAHLLEGLTSLGLTRRWQLLLALNLFLLVLGMVMDGFSAIIVAVPLVVPLAARFGFSPFHLAMILILNLELAFCMPPLGLNLFISSFRFRQPLTLLYRSTMPFVGLLALSLAIVTAVPWLSSALLQPDIDAARAEAERLGEAPVEAWKLECVQEDPTHPKPCSAADRARWAPGATSEGDDALLEEMMRGEPGRH
jgi:C4-dicarboxylate transporter DctM subunit